jgi:3-methyladenine DNA glycosylase AlkD
MEEIASYINEVNQVLKAEADSDNASQQKSYMRDKFEFFGIKAKPRRKATREFIRKDKRPDYGSLEDVVKRLWELPEREFQYFGQELVERYTDDFEREIIGLLEYMITNKSWWDTVDMIAKKLVGNYFLKFPDTKHQYLVKWIDSDNIWLQRTAILFQLGYQDNTDLELLFKIIKQLKDIDEFFIQKAIGWSLREYSKINAEVILKFVKNNQLSSLAEREALKKINSY